ncbi:ethanolamine ammonia-lyase reactivating factor EutA [Salmonella enterica subsp. enterica]|nr:ethanolamine ammonia-lyase reactivating factor EutA [Salmonella enterica subsp. enterica]
MIIDEVFGSGTDARACCRTVGAGGAADAGISSSSVITGALPPLAQSLMQTAAARQYYAVEVINFPVAGECHRNQPADPPLFCFSDIGPLLATALHEHPRSREMNVQFPAQNRTRHVIGVGAHTLAGQYHSV